MSNILEGTHEVLALVSGIVALIISILFLLQRTGIYQVTLFDMSSISDGAYLMFFTITTIVLSIVCLITTVKSYIK